MSDLTEHLVSVKISGFEESLEMMIESLSKIKNKITFTMTPENDGGFELMGDIKARHQLEAMLMTLESFQDTGEIEC